MSTLGLVVTPWQHEMFLFIRKVYFFPMYVAINKDFFCPTHSHFVGCNVMQFCMFALVHTKQKKSYQDGSCPTNFG